MSGHFSAYLKLPRVRVRSGYFRCMWCDLHRYEEHARYFRRGREFMCERCYTRHRVAARGFQKEQRDTRIRMRDSVAQQDHIWLLRVEAKRRRPDPWRDYVRLALTRVLLNRASSLEDGYERESLCGYIALGMEVAK